MGTWQVSVSGGLLGATTSARGSYDQIVIEKNGQPYATLDLDAALAVDFGSHSGIDLLGLGLDDLLSPLLATVLGGEPDEAVDNLHLVATPGLADLAQGVEVDIVGNDMAETILGTDTINFISAKGGDDIIDAGAGNDTIDGGTGGDTMRGGAGNDTYIVDTSRDKVIETANAGIDTVRTAGSYTLTANVEKLVLTGTKAVNGTGNDLGNVLTGNQADNTLDGRAGADVLAGLGGNDTYIIDNAKDRISEQAGGGTDTARASVSYSLSANVEKLVLTGTTAINGNGSADDNAITGNSARNVIDGRGGADDLFGGAGTDVFVFSTELGAGNVDRIMDFSAADDTIRLVKSAFAGLDIGALPVSAFKDVAVSAIDANDRILYDHDTGVLSYDADGSGSAAAVQFAVVNNHAILSASDFQIV